jgi:outer membrane receptor for ferrienterochelin and colicin
MKYIISLFFAAAICSCLNAQQISGTVYGANRETLPAANVFWEGVRQGVSADHDGKFSIDIPSSGKTRLIASFVGYQNDTIDVPAGAVRIEFVLSEGMMLGETVDSARRRGNYLSRITPIQTEIITTAGLQKMACCNLAESFENSATVTVSFTDAVSGAKQIQMLGLSGVYTQMLDENIPALRGLASTFGWNYVPGPWLESIQVSKGTSSVINGYESTTGQINLEFKKPSHSDLLFLNLFGSGDGRMEANVTSAVPVGKNLWTGLMLHGSAEQTEHDGNSDGFMDMPKTKLFNIYNRWLYDNHEKGVESRTGVKFLYDERDAGQMSKIADYRTRIENRNFNVSNKTGFAFGKREGQSIGIISSFTHHEIDSEYGAKKYSGKQNTFYGNVLISSYFANPAHQFVTGGSFLYDRFDERYSDTLTVNLPPTSSITPDFRLSREEIVPGAFFQYTYSGHEKMMVIVGLRGDYHNRFGMLFTPRTNIKYNFTDHIIFRVSAGRGYRSPNVISENIGFLASSRYYHIQSVQDLDIEKAWNYGANLTFYIPMPGNETMTVGMDYYRTDFENQAIVDTEYDRRQIYFYNLHGKSYANAWQIDVNTRLFRGFDIYAAFRWSDTKITYSKDDQRFTADKPLMNKYRGLVNLSYATNFEKWKFDFTAQFNGSSRLPNLSYSGYTDSEDRSPAYPLYYAQITKKTKRLEIYAGCENIFNYKQKNPIIDAENPFGSIFDASRIWGPLMGRKFYAGIRLVLGEIK